MNKNSYSIEKAPCLNHKQQLKMNQQKGWSRLVKDIVRPPRSIYKESDLGTPTFTFNNFRYSRQDLPVCHQQKTITLTIFEPEVSNNWIILYLHGNSSSKMEATGILKFLPFRFALAAFDFIGCGLNKQADTISLGYREADQVQTVAKALQNRGYRVILWGRSMGAATALKYGKVPIIVADSSFQSFRTLCKQVAIRHSPSYIPNCLISCFFPCVFYKLKTDVKEKGEYDVDSLDILSAVKNINLQTSIIFMSGDEDQLVEKMNSQNLYNNYNGKKKHLQIFKGSHNGKRPDATLKTIMKIIVQHVEQFNVQRQSVSKTRIQVQTDG